MTREEAKKIMENEVRCVRNPNCERLECRNCYLVMPEHTVLKAYEVAIKALEQEPCEDCVSRQAAIDALMKWYGCEPEDIGAFGTIGLIKELPPVTPQPKTGHCKDCKWWKDSDGSFRRGVGAESQCPMNRIEVYEGNGYCFMFEPQERSGEE